MHRLVLSLLMFLQLLAISGSETSWTKARGCNQTTKFSSPWWSFPPLACLINFWIHLYSWHPNHPVATGSTTHLSIEWQRYFLWVFQKIFIVIPFLCCLISVSSKPQYYYPFHIIHVFTDLCYISVISCLSLSVSISLIFL